MATNNSDFRAAIYQLADDNDLDPEAVMQVVKNAVLTAYKKQLKDEFEKEDDMSHFDVDFDEETGEFVVLADKKVVSVMTDPATQLLESQAKLIDPRLREGDHIQIDVTPENFGRIAAQAAKQRITQGLRDAVRETMIAKYEDKVGKIISGVVQRKDPNYVRVEVDKAEAIMPTEEQIPGEFYRSAERRRFLLVRLANTVTDKRMVLSRGSEDFLKALFDLEVPEVSTGSVEIVNIAREPGSRSKVAVHSKHEKVDAIGACVGPRGTRIDSIMNEIDPEKVDIILWDKDIKNYIINSLSPAKVADIKVDKKNGTAKVLVNEDALSLAIGKDGQNVRLAAKLTGYKIDITSNKEEFETKEESGESEVTEEKMTKKRSTKSEELAIEQPMEKEVVENTYEVTGIVNDSPALNIDELPGLTEEHKALLKENHVDTIDELMMVVTGEKVIEAFTKRDITKIKKLIGENEVRNTARGASDSGI